MKANLISKIALTATIYVVITIIFSPISYGPVQVRLSEMLTLLPFIWGAWAALALWLGCMLANVFGGLGLIDIIGGSFITLAAGLLTSKAPNIWTAALPPIILNAFGIAAILTYILEVPYWPTVFYVGIGQFISVGIIGIPLITKLTSKFPKFFS